MIFSYVLLVVNGINVRTANSLSVSGSNKANCILYNCLHLGNIESREGLVTGLEVEYLSVYSLIKNSGTEHLSARLVAYKQNLIGVRNGKGLTVGLLTLKLEESVYTAGNRM